MVRHLSRCVLGFLAAFASPRADAFEWQVDITPADQLFPALQLSQAPRALSSTASGDGDGLVSVHVRGHDIPDDLRVRIDTPGLRVPGTAAAGGARAATSLELRPRLDWDVEQLSHLTGPRKQTMTVTLAANGRESQSRQFEVRLHPLDDALYFVREGHDRVDLGWAFAGYVNPQDPVVDEVLAAARAFDPGFDAQATEHGAAADRRRVGAVWAALERRGLRYADGDPALSRGPSVWSQRVRLLRAVWNDRRANCLDSSVLIASVLERLGVRTLIVLVPGHAFVGYGGSAGHDDVQYLETTLLGARSGGHDTSTARAAANFDTARVAGHARWRKVAARFDGRHGPAYAVVDIGTARSYGIIPFSAGGDRHP